MVCSVACAPGHSESTVHAERFAHVFVNVFGWNDARAGAVIVDRNGRRIGWLGGRPIDEIVGCEYEAGSEEGIPDERSSGGSLEESEPRTTKADIPSDSAGDSRLTPMDHAFFIRNWSDTTGLINDGGCELRLSGVVDGRVDIAVTGALKGLRRMCKDTASVWVKAGSSSRWRLSWRALSDSCRVEIAQVSGGGTGSKSKVGGTGP